MSAVRAVVRRGTYLDSVVLMQVQRALVAEPGVEEAGAVMATPANREVLRDAGLWTDELAAARVDDLLVAVRAGDAGAAEAALGRLDALLAARAGGGGGNGGAGGDYRFKSLAAALRARPTARWVLVSVPGRHAAAVADEALAAGRHVFLYSDNVSVDDEVRLKRRARERGLLVLGPDCGTAIVAGAGLGFANRVRRGAIGLVAASGTGLQAVTTEIDRRGADVPDGGVSQAIGVGGRDLSAEVGGLTTLAALDLFRRDPATRVVVLVSKPPAAATCARVLAAAGALGKPVVACFQGLAAPIGRLGGVHLATGLEDAARRALELARSPAAAAPATSAVPSPRGRYLRGLFAGGTLAQELQLAVRPLLDPLASNSPVAGVAALDDPHTSRGHAIVDMGADELTVGRPHPMLDGVDRAARLRRELADPEVAAVVVDLVLGDGAHPDPAADLAAAVRAAGPEAPPVLAWVVGSDEDPQGLAGQVAALQEAGVRVHRGLQELVDDLVPRLPWERGEVGVEVDLAAFASPLAAINVGVEPFAASLAAQGAHVTRVEWRPPAGGDEKLAGILGRLKARREA